MIWADYGNKGITVTFNYKQQTKRRKHFRFKWQGYVFMTLVFRTGIQQTLNKWIFIILHQEGAKYGPRATSGPQRLIFFRFDCDFLTEMWPATAPRDTNNEQCGPRTKIVAHPALHSSRNLMCTWIILLAT